MSEPQGGVVVFDLDDTLYLESDFAKSGFEAASAWLDREMGVANFADHCHAIFATGRRSRVFDEALAAAGMAGDRTLTAKLIEVFRQHHPRIALAPDALEYLCNPARKARLALITDGYAATQMAKVKALGLEGASQTTSFIQMSGGRSFGNRIRGRSRLSKNGQECRARSWFT